MILRAPQVKGVHYNKMRAYAISVLQQCAKLARARLPHYAHQISESRRKPGHVYHCRFHVPRFVLDAVQAGPIEGAVVGSGHDEDEHLAKELAALDCLWKLEEHCARRLPGILKMYQKQQRVRIEQWDIAQELPGVSWQNLPLDRAFPRRGSRWERLTFTPALIQNTKAFATAKAITLASKETLPEVILKKNKDTQRDTHINIKTNSQRHGVLSVRGPGFTKPFADDMIPELRRELALQDALQRIRHQMVEEKHGTHLLELLEKSNPSFGMAKLFVALPDHHVKRLISLLRYTIKNPLPRPSPLELITPRQRRQPITAETTTTAAAAAADDDAVQLQRRIEALRRHQRAHPLPVDDVEHQIPHDALVTIVQGGTGSGKTTRYPLLLSLFGDGGTAATGTTPPRVVVAQPRRLACQAAAERVAYEQGYYESFISSGGAKDKDDDCPIGYAIRFDGKRARGRRTVEFATPGVLLRRAVADPWMEDVTHLVVDEVHERNADIDLLLSLAKQAVQARRDHPTLPPLRLVLMSATVEASSWERYFSSEDLNTTTLATVEVPAVRPFPIDTVHLDEPSFPRGDDEGNQLRSLLVLEESKRSEIIDMDEALCKATAELVLHLFRTKEELKDGTVLCFLPGMEEIRAVSNFLRMFGRGRRQNFDVRFLHSSVSPQEQRLVFEPGPKVVLSTNIAETSLTIADVKFVIDGGRERQHSLMNSSSSSATTVVASQLMTVNISQAAAKQRAGRAGRVSAGTCYRLYSRTDMEAEFLPYTVPEMLRMDLSQLVLHALSFANEEAGHPLQLLMGAPDPPTESNLRQTLSGLKHQGLVEYDPADESSVRLTPLGRVVSEIPATPRIGRMLYMGLVLRAIEPALQIAAILSVPKLFGSDYMEEYKLDPNKQHCSDTVQVLEEFQKFLKLDGVRRNQHPEAKKFEQVRRIKWQLEQHMLQFIRRKAKVSKTDEVMDSKLWNENSHRLASLVALVCTASPHIAHLVRNDNSFSTRDVVEEARMHPSSVNFPDERRVPWYCYNELRATKKPYLLGTTAVSPLDLALFSDSSDGKIDESTWEGDVPTNISDDEWLFLVDQWVPVSVADPKHRETFLKLRKMLTDVMLQQVATDPASALMSPEYKKIVQYTLSALEQQRLSPG